MDREIGMTYRGLLAVDCCDGRRLGKGCDGRKLGRGSDERGRADFEDLDHDDPALGTGAGRRGDSMTSRRAFVAGAVTALIAPLAAETFSGSCQAQPATKPYRVGLLAGGSPPAQRAPLTEALRELGYVDGQNLVIESRHAEGRPESLPTLAGELVRLNVDVIVTVTTPATLAAKNATATIPI